MSWQIAAAVFRLLHFGLAFICAGLLAAVILFLLAYYRLQSLKVEGQDFVATLRQVPITVPLAIDLADFALDVVGAPLTWLILGRLGLGALQSITLVEGLIPGTQLLPLLTLCWLGVRIYDWLRRRDCSFTGLTDIKWLGKQRNKAVGSGRATK